MWICLHNSFALWFCGWISSADIQYLPGIDKENLAQSACSSNWSAGRPRKIFCNTVPYHTWGCSSEGYLFHFFLFRYFFGIPVFLLFLLFCCSAIFCFSVFFFLNLLLLCFFRFFAVPAVHSYLLFCFSAFLASLFSASLFFPWFAFLLLYVSVFSASAPFYFYLFFFCSHAFLLLYFFLLLCFSTSFLYCLFAFFFLCPFLSCLYPQWNPTVALDETQRHPEEIPIRNPKWNPTDTLNIPKSS